MMTPILFIGLLLPSTCSLPVTQGLPWGLQFATCQQHLNSPSEQLALSFSWPKRRSMTIQGAYHQASHGSRGGTHTQQQYSKHSMTGMP